MRVLVLGATGYVGSRLVPALLAAGHEVVAASSSPPAPERFAWGAEVTWARCDVTDAEAVSAALAGVDGLAYLVHSLDVRGFSQRDRLGAERVRDALARSGVRRVVYLSGLVPDVPEATLSRHLASRLEVERILAQCADAGRTFCALRAGVVVGAGSTSFEVVRQLASLLPVTPVPSWLRSQVQPVSVTDAVRALVEAFDGDRLVGAVDVGGPDVVPYARLLRLTARAAGLWRVRVPVPARPSLLTSLATAGLVTAPFWTVASLVESLKDDMVCRPEATWVPADGVPLVGLEEALRRSCDPHTVTLEGALPSDPEWTRVRVPVLRHLPAPASVRTAAQLGWHRARRFLPGR